MGIYGLVILFYMIIEYALDLYAYLSAWKLGRPASGLSLSRI